MEVIRASMEAIRHHGLWSLLYLMLCKATIWSDSSTSTLVWLWVRTCSSCILKHNLVLAVLGELACPEVRPHTHIAPVTHLEMLWSRQVFCADFSTPVTHGLGLIVKRSYKGCSKMGGWTGFSLAKESRQLIPWSSFSLVFFFLVYKRVALVFRDGRMAPGFGDVLFHYLLLHFVYMHVLWQFWTFDWLIHFMFDINLVESLCLFTIVVLWFHYWINIYLLNKA